MLPRHQPDRIRNKRVSLYTHFVLGRILGSCVSSCVCDVFMCA